MSYKVRSGKMRGCMLVLVLVCLSMSSLQAQPAPDTVFPVWLPDGDSLLLFTDSTVWQLTLEASEYTLTPLPLENETIVALMSVSADGAFLAYYAHPEIRLFSLAAGEIVERFVLPEPGFPRNLTLSPDAEFVAVNYLGVYLALFQRGNAEPIAVIDHADYATINAEWDLIVSGPGNEVRFWALDTDTSSAITPTAYRAPAVGYVYLMDMHRNMLAYGDREGTLYLVNTANGDPLWTLPFYDGFCGERGFNVAFSLDGELLAANCSRNDQLALIETSTGEVIAAAEERRIYAAIWLENHLLTLSNQQATLRALPDLEPLAVFEGRYASVDSAGTRLVQTADSGIQIWDLLTAELLYEIPYEGL